MAKSKRKRRVARVKAPSNCPFSGPEEIDYKDADTLENYITTRGRMISSERTGVCPKCQRKLAVSIKRARFMALIPYTQYV